MSHIQTSHLLTHSMKQSSSWEAKRFSVKKFPAFNGAKIFIAAFTSVRHLTLSWASSIQSIPPHPTSWRSILILSSHLRLGHPSGLFPSNFPPEPLIRLSSTSYVLHAQPIVLLDFINRKVSGDQHRSLSSSLCSFLHFPVTSSLLGPNILLNTLFSNTLSLRSSLNYSDQISHPYKTTGKIIIERRTTHTQHTTCCHSTKLI